MTISYATNLAGVNWTEMKASLSADDFDNGRTPQELELSFRNSHSAVVAYDSGTIVGTARVLSDGVCNAYLVDVWTRRDHRRNGIATRMIEILTQPLLGQHVYLQTDDATDLYRKLGFREQPIGMSKVIGRWLADGRERRAGGDGASTQGPRSGR